MRNKILNDIKMLEVIIPPKLLDYRKNILNRNYTLTLELPGRVSKDVRCVKRRIWSKLVYQIHFQMT